MKWNDEMKEWNDGMMSVELEVSSEVFEGDVWWRDLGDKVSMCEMKFRLVMVNGKLKLVNGYWVERMMEKELMEKMGNG